MDPAPTLKNYSHLERRLIDMPYIFSESLDHSQQHLHRCILIFFENFLGRALTDKEPQIKGLKKFGLEMEIFF